LRRLADREAQLGEGLHRGIQRATGLGQVIEAGCQVADLYGHRRDGPGGADTKGEPEAGGHLARLRHEPAHAALDRLERGLGLVDRN